MTSIETDIAEADYRPVLAAAILTIVSLLVAGVGWGMFARLDSATVARGVLFAETERKSIENLEGGILERLLVVPGDRVTAGQIVAVLDTTQTRETLAQLNLDRLALTHDIWRLKQEAQGTRWLDPATAPRTGGLMDEARVAAQLNLFDARLRAHEGGLASLRLQIGSLRSRIVAARAQATAANRQRNLWQEERTLIATLVDRGATPRQRLLEVDRTLAALEGIQIEQTQSARSAAEDIARLDADIETTVQTHLATIVAQLTEASRMLDGTISRIRASEDIIQRQNLRAPQDGVIVNILTNSPGAILGSGVSLMELVPDGDRLMILARIPPDAIDSVHPGRPAKIHLTAFRRAITPVVEGTVEFVSADLLEDERDGTPYFEVRIAIDPDSLATQKDVDLVSGMPVDVAIQIGERRAGEYILEPIYRHFRRAFNEE
jgi:HlyD family secretion protein